MLGCYLPCPDAAGQHRLWWSPGWELWGALGDADMGRGRQEEGKGLWRVWVSWIPLLGMASPSIPVYCGRGALPVPDPDKLELGHGAGCRDREGWQTLKCYLVLLAPSNCIKNQCICKTPEKSETFLWNISVSPLPRNQVTTSAAAGTLLAQLFHSSSTQHQEIQIIS